VLVALGLALVTLVVSFFFLEWQPVRAARHGAALGQVLRSPDGRWTAVLRVAAAEEPMRILVQIQEPGGKPAGEYWQNLWPGAYAPMWLCPSGVCEALQIELATTPERRLRLPPTFTARLRTKLP
jgi:hypothetical protein